ncbi:MAG: endo-1,4-beta-xylanase [Burkholderiaceae bacterium]|nr:endo-1,4-beta-xylanase [Burkholderiaceae bacterium]
MHDKDSWLAESKSYPDWNWLFGGDGRVKPAFCGELEALQESR